MKIAAVLAASLAAAAVSSVSLTSAYDRRVSDDKGSASSSGKDGGSGSRRGRANDKFAPRFDGLRFIETLVTAHR